MIYALLITEYFKHSVRDLKISDDRTTVTSFSHFGNATFGAFIINCNENNSDIYTWQIKINSIGSIINIGVDEVNDSPEFYSSYYWMRNCLHYAYSNVSKIFHHGYLSDDNNAIDLDDEFCYSTDDIITMIIDCGKKTVDFYKNDKHVYQCKNVHPNQYRLGIQLCGYIAVSDKGCASVTLQNFSISVCN